MFDGLCLTPESTATHASASALFRLSRTSLALAKNNSKLQSLCETVMDTNQHIHTVTDHFGIP
eukprot:887374-Pleurochrysis_carterae.AAC.1